MIYMADLFWILSCVLFNFVFVYLDSGSSVGVMGKGDGSFQGSRRLEFNNTLVTVDNQTVCR